jgi:hypothetical protein
MAAAAHIAVGATDFDCRGRGTRLASLIPPLTLHPYLSSQNQTLGLLARFHQTARHQFKIEPTEFHLLEDYRFYAEKSGQNKTSGKGGPSSIEPDRKNSLHRANNPCAFGASL